MANATAPDRDPDRSRPDPASAAVIRSDLEALVAQFAWSIDHEEGRGVADLFTEEGVYGFEFGAMEGRAAIDGFYAWRRGGEPRLSRHVFSNLHLKHLTAARAAATCVLTLHAGNGIAPLPMNPVLVADYDDEFELGTDGVWRFARRTMTLVFGEFPHLRSERR